MLGAHPAPGCPSYVPRQKAIPRRACSVQMAHQVARRLAVLRALPYPGPPSLGKPVVVVGWQGLLSAPGLQLSVPHMYHYHLTRHQWPTIVRMALGALPRAFACSCIPE